MPLSGPYARFGKLTTPVTIDGTTYTHAVRWLDPNSSCASRSIVSGTVYSVTSLGGDSYKVVMTRGVQYSSYVVVQAGSQNYEVEYPCSCGGNIVQAPECMQVISHANTAYAHRGINRYGRIPRSGSVVKFPNSVGWGGLVTEAVPYGESPSDGVNWITTDEGAAGIWYPNVDMATLNIIDEAGDLADGVSIYFAPESAEPFDDIQVFGQDSGTGTVIELTREIFDNPTTGSPDEYYYPDDASFTATDNYYYEPDALDFRFPAGLASHGGNSIDTLLCRYYLSGQVPLTVDAGSNQELVIEADGTGTGYGASDEIAFAYEAIEGDFDLYLSVSHGDGALEWRYTLDDDACAVAIEFEDSVSGCAVTQVRHRATQGGSWTISAASSSASDPLYLRIVRTGTGFATYYSSSGSSWTLAAGVTLTDPVADQIGFLGISTNATVKVLGVNSGAFDGEISPIGFGVDIPTLYALRTITKSSVSFTKTFTAPFSEDLTGVYNITADASMGQTLGGGDTGRLKYDKSGSSFTFYSESSGDRIRVSHEAPATGDDAPGRPPRVRPNQLNCATADVIADPAGGIGTTDATQNHLNWRDYVIATIPGYTPVAGETVQFYTKPIFDPRTPPTLSYRTATTGSWTNLGSSDHKTYYVDGLTLLSTAFMAGLGSNKPHFRATGTMFVNSSSVTSDAINYPVNALEALDQAAIEAGDITTTGDGVHGLAGNSVGITGYSCNVSPAGWIPDGVGYGLKKDYYHTIVDGGNSYPYWSYPPITYNDTALRLNVGTADDTTYYCPESPPTNPRQDHDEWEAGDFAMTVTIGAPSAYNGRWAEYNYQDDGMGGWTNDQYTRANHFGNQPGTSPYLVNSVAASFGFNGIGLNIPRWFQYLPDDVEIVDCLLEVKFGGLLSKSWSGTYDFDGISTPNTVTYEFYEQGQLVNDSTGTLNIPPEPSTSTILSFHLVGREIRSERVTTIGGTVQDYNAGPWVGIGGGSVVADSGSIDGDKWQIISIKNAMQAIFDDRNSKRRQYQLWPTNTASYGGGSAEGAANGLTNYLKSLMPNTSVTSFTAGTSPGKYSYSLSASGRFTCYDTLDLGECIVYLRFPSGEIQAKEIVLQDQQPVIGEYSP